MQIVDTALEKRLAEGNPVRVAMVGAGYMARGISLEILTGIRGMKLVAVANRTIDQAERTYRDAGIDEFVRCTTLSQVNAALAAGKYVVTEDALLLCKADGIEAIVETTGHVEHGAHVAVETIRNGKHLILGNVELDATVGPILKVHADRAGVVFTDTDGDEPGVAMNLFRFVKTIGYRPVLAGNIKGMIDRYRTPETQRAFAEKVNQKPVMITSFADGTKLSMEAAILCNATGLRVDVRGMHGHPCAHVKEILTKFPPEKLLKQGLVEYTLGAEPHTGAFVVGYNENPIKQQYMKYFKMGDGPLYLFYTPYHLPQVQLPLTVARAVLFRDPTVTPIGAPVVDVVTVAKRDLEPGEVLDGIGGFHCYGSIDNYEVSEAGDLLPMGLSEGCRVMRRVPKDQALSFADVELPPGRLSDQLREEQTKHFAKTSAQPSPAPAR
ncbi:MAG TPA: NAD(P)-dependent oxidoreductase [Candidatus Eisenbacteria bacterium]|nr:NAD(P)-dependent oxidoreductase [Candidatus Eisenbacteria bacterium]